MAIFEFLTVYIADIIGQVGYLGIFILMALESVCLPIPSEVVMTFGGFAAQRGDLNFWLVGLTGSLGCLAGSTIAYVIGYYGGRPFLKKYGKFVMIGEHDIDRADRWFSEIRHRSSIYNPAAAYSTYVYLDTGGHGKNELHEIRHIFLRRLAAVVLCVNVCGHRAREKLGYAPAILDISRRIRHTSAGSAGGICPLP